MFDYQDQAGCEGWTWLSEASLDYQEHCFIFSSLGDVENFPHCVREGKIFPVLYIIFFSQRASELSVQ